MTDVVTEFKIKIRCLILHRGSDGADVFRAEVNSVSHPGRLRDAKGLSMACGVAAEPLFASVHDAPPPRL